MGADVAGVIDGGLLCSAVTWWQCMGWEVSLGVGDMVPVGGFVNGLSGQQRGR